MFIVLKMFIKMFIYVMLYRAVRSRGAQGENFLNSELKQVTFLTTQTA